MPYVEDCFSMDVLNAVYSSNYLCKHLKLSLLSIPALKRVVKYRASEHERTTSAIESFTSKHTPCNNIKPITTITIINDHNHKCNLRGLDEMQELTSFNLDLQVTKCQEVEIAIPNNVQHFRLSNLDLGQVFVRFTSIPPHLKQLELICPLSGLVLPDYPPHLLAPYIPYMKSCTMIANPLNSPPLIFTQLDLNLPETTYLDPHPPAPQFPSSLRVLKLQPDWPNTYTFSDFPPSLEQLELFGGFTTPLGGLPKTLKTLRFWPVSLYPCFVDNSMHTDLLRNLPVGLETLHARYLEDAHVPDSVEHLSFTESQSSLPANLRVLNMSEYREGPYGDATKFARTLDNPPPYLTELVLPEDLSISSIDNLPATLRKIQFGWKFNQPLQLLPERLQVLIFKGYGGHENRICKAIKFNHPLDHLPAGLREIRFEGDSKYNQPFGHLPAQLEILQLLHADERTLAKLEFKRLMPRYELPHPSYTTPFLTNNMQSLRKEWDLGGAQT